MKLFLRYLLKQNVLIKIKFFPDEYIYYYIEIEGPVATPIEVTNRRLKEITQFMLPGIPGQLKSATAIAGFFIDEDYQPIFGSNNGHIIVEMPAKKEEDFQGESAKGPIFHLKYMRKQLSRFQEGGKKRGGELRRIIYLL